jgi:hypothetical protein
MPQGLLHAGLIKAPGVGYTLVPERIQLGVLEQVLCVYYKASAMGLSLIRHGPAASIRHGPVSGSAISACVQYRRAILSNWAARYGKSAIPPLMGHPGLLI